MTAGIDDWKVLLAAHEAAAAEFSKAEATLTTRLTSGREPTPQERAAVETAKGRLAAARRTILERLAAREP
jgi:hypothetical protein